MKSLPNILKNVYFFRSIIAGEKYRSSSTAKRLLTLQKVFIANVSAGSVRFSWFFTLES